MSWVKVAVQTRTIFSIVRVTSAVKSQPSSLGLTFRWPAIILISLILPIIFIALAKLRWKCLVKEARTCGK